MWFPVGKSTRCRFVGTSDRVCHGRLNKHPACGVGESLEWNETFASTPTLLGVPSWKGAVPASYVFQLTFIVTLDEPRGSSWGGPSLQ